MPGQTTQPIRVLLLTWVFSDTFPGGDVRLSWFLANELAKHGLEVHILSSWVHYSVSIPHNLHVYHVPFSGLEAGFSQEAMMRSFLCALPLVVWKRIDIIHLISGQQPSPFAIFKLRPFVESVFTTWDYSDPRFAQDLAHDRSEKNAAFGMAPSLSLAGRLFRKATSVFYKLFGVMREEYQHGVDLWVCYTNSAERMISRLNYPAPRIVVPLGYDHTIFNLPEGKGVGEKSTFTFLMAAGAISRRKGVHYVIQAFKRIHAEFSEARLVLVGNAAPKAIREFKDLAANDSAIEFREMMPPGNMAMVMKASDTLVLASLGEPFGVVLLEAGACGLPLIATNAGGGPPDIVQDGKMGYLVEPASEVAVYQAMHKLISDKPRAKAMGRHAAEVFRARYTWDVLTRHIIEVGYKPLLDARTNKAISHTFHR